MSAPTNDPNVKQLVVTGGAAESFLNKGTRRRRRTSAPTRKAEKAQEGGSTPAATIQIEASRAAPLPTANSISQAKASNASALAKNVTNSASAVVNVAAASKEAVGGAAAKPVKVILGAGKKKTRVVLAPAKVKKVPSLTTGTAPSIKTRKVAKKIRMSLGGFGKRVTRANSIRHEAKKQTIEDVKKTLVEAKLVKADSKAPETVLRQMYADYMVIKNRAL